jgi:glycosyltransferase involved in cell wall biosynthesis
MNLSRCHLLIPPCREEAQYLRGTLDSVAAQSVPPALWVVVDDGSTDATSAILKGYARYAPRLPYLSVVRRTDRSRQEVGPGVIEAFYTSLETVRPDPSNFNHYQNACPRIGKRAGFSWCILVGQSRLYLPGMVASVSVAGFFLWFGIHRSRRTENSFAYPI